MISREIDRGVALVLGQVRTVGTNQQIPVIAAAVGLIETANIAELSFGGIEVGLQTARNCLFLSGCPTTTRTCGMQLVFETI